jgi:hypothetical protein
VDRAGELFLQSLVDQAMARHAILTGESVGRDVNSEMTFTALRRSGVPGVQGAVIGDFKRFRLQRSSKSVLDPLLHLTHVTPPFIARQPASTHTLTHGRFVQIPTAVQGYPHQAAEG